MQLLHRGAAIKAACYRASFPLPWSKTNNPSCATCRATSAPASSARFGPRGNRELCFEQQKLTLGMTLPSDTGSDESGGQ